MLTKLYHFNAWMYVVFSLMWYHLLWDYWFFHMVNNIIGNHKSGILQQNDTKTSRELTPVSTLRSVLSNHHTCWWPWALWCLTLSLPEYKWWTCNWLPPKSRSWNYSLNRRNANLESCGPTGNQHCLCLFKLQVHLIVSAEEEGKGRQRLSSMVCLIHAHRLHSLMRHYNFSLGGKNTI